MLVNVSGYKTFVEYKLVLIGITCGASVPKKMCKLLLKTHTHMYTYKNQMSHKIQNRIETIGLRENSLEMQQHHWLIRK